MHFHQVEVPRMRFGGCIMAAALVLGCKSGMAFTHRAISPNASRHVCRGVRTRSGGFMPGLPFKLRLWPSSLFSSPSPTAGADLEEVDPGQVEGLRIIKYPDPRLRAANEEITEFGPELQQLAKNMLKLMYAANGVGLAAPQVGVNKRLMVFNPEGDRLKWLSEMILVNPRIVDKSGKSDVEEEGCLSFPGMNGDVERSLNIKVDFMDVKGKKRSKRFKDWEARIFQHEYDHLDGVLYIDRLSPEGRQKVQPVLDSLIAAHGPGGAL